MTGCYHLFILCIISSLLASLCELIIPRIISFAIDTVLGGSSADSSSLPQAIIEKLNINIHGDNTILIFAVVICVLAALLGIFKYGEAVFDRKGSEKLAKNMRDGLFGHIVHLPFSWFSKQKTGDIIQRCTSDVELVRDFLSEQLTYVVTTVIMIALSLVFMFSVNIVVATVSLMFVPLIVAFSLIFHMKISNQFEKADENEGKLSAICQENLTGVRVVRAFGQERYEISKYKKQNDLYTNDWIRLGKILSVYWAVGDIISGIQVMSVLVASTVLCVSGTLSVGELVSLVLYNSMLVWPVRSLGRTISEMSKAGVSLKRIDGIMSAETEKDAPDAVECDPEGDISFSHVSYSFGGEKKVLDDVSFTVKKGQTVGIIGMTGSGKSTLVSLLCRLYDLDEGDGKITINGTDIRNIKLESLRKNVGIVLQEPFLFSRTLKENIGISFNAIEEHEFEIKEAVRESCLEDTIDNFTQGYDTKVGERGVTLSGGQKQRTAIARLLATDPPIMIFDDSLSAVDSETDAKIRRAIVEHSRDKTVFIISHRTQTIAGSDFIIVLSGGKIAESGTHEELMKEHGIYRKLYDIQHSFATEAAEEVSA